MVTRSIFMTKFMVIDVPTHYNTILGRSWIQKVKVIILIFYQVIQYPTKKGIKEIRGN